MTPTPTPTHPRRRLLHTGLGLSLLALAGLAQAAPAVNTLKDSLFGGRTDTAINGYDPVAYFTEGKPVKGLAQHSITWQGAKWQFASAENLAKFQADPERWAPQYGGYCAYGVAQEHLVKVAPDQFTVRDGKLYLNYDADVQAKWRMDPAGYIRDADAKFRALLAK